MIAKRLTEVASRESRPGLLQCREKEARGTRSFIWLQPRFDPAGNRDHDEGGQELDARDPGAGSRSEGGIDSRKHASQSSRSSSTQRVAQSARRRGCARHVGLYTGWSIRRKRRVRRRRGGTRGRAKVLVPIGSAERPVLVRDIPRIASKNPYSRLLREDTRSTSTSEELLVQLERGPCGSLPGVTFDSFPSLANELLTQCGIP